MSELSAVLSLLVAGPCAILASSLSLTGFRALYGGLTSFASHRSRVPLLDYLRPGTGALACSPRRDRLWGLTSEVLAAAKRLVLSLEANLGRGASLLREQALSRKGSLSAARVRRPAYKLQPSLSNVLLVRSAAMHASCLPCLGWCSRRCRAACAHPDCGLLRGTGPLAPGEQQAEAMRRAQPFIRATCTGRAATCSQGMRPRPCSVCEPDQITG